MQSYQRALTCAWAMLVAASVAAADEWAAVADDAPELAAYEDVDLEDVKGEFPAAFWDAANADPRCDDGIFCGNGVDCGAGIDPTPPSRGRWTALTEVTVLVPSYSDSTFEAKHRAFVGPRVTLGWEGASGFGIRGRGWGFDGATHAERNNLPSFVSTHELLFSGARLDLDFYKRIQHSTGDFAFGVGVTAARLTLRERYLGTTPLNQSYYPILNPRFIEDAEFFDDYYYDANGNIIFLDRSPGLAHPVTTFSTNGNGVVTAVYQGNGLVRNTGVGVGLMMEGTHRFYETPRNVWALFGRGRVAYLVGELEAPQSIGRTEGDSNMALGEAALGVQYTRRFKRADVSLLCGFEVQSWDVTVVDRVNLAGVTTGLGVNW